MLFARLGLSLLSMGIAAANGAQARPSPSPKPPEELKLTYISPSIGISTGGESVQIRGSGFTYPITVLIGGGVCKDVRILTPNELVCHTPPHAQGTMHITVQTGPQGPPAPDSDETAGSAAVSKFYFTFYKDLTLRPIDATIPVDSKKIFKGQGGVPPYQFRIVTGQGTIDLNSGEFHADKEPTEGVIEIRDHLGRTAQTGYMTYLPLQVFPSTRAANTGENFRITPMGGLPPYQIEHISGQGTLHPAALNFTAPNLPGSDVLKITDSNGTSVKLLVESTDAFYRPQKIGAGDSHTCAIIADHVECWGQNTAGELGAGLSSQNSYYSVNVANLSKKIRVVTAGAHHTCALSAEGELKCWGDNRYGQLGDGTYINRNKPVTVLGLETGVRAVSAGGFHTCAVTLANSILCWGRNDWGQLGTSSKVSSNLPLRIQGIDDKIQEIASGRNHTCAIVEGGVRCWGQNQSGQLGNGTHTDSPSPVQVKGLTPNVQDIGAGWANTCVINGDAVQCWGYDPTKPSPKGELAKNMKALDSVVTPVKGLESAVQRITVSQFHSCAIRGGKMLCWGYNYHGELADPNYENHAIPIEVKGLVAGIDDIAVGESHSCALLLDRRVMCWGDNTAGQLGNGTYQRKLAPELVRHK